MLKTELIGGVKHLNDVLESSGVITLLSNIVEGLRSQVSKETRVGVSAEQLLRTFYSYDAEARNFSDPEKEIIHIMDLDSLGDLSWRVRVMSLLVVEGRDVHLEMQQIIFPVYHSLQNFCDVSPRLIGMLDSREPTSVMSASGIHKDISDDSDFETLTLILPEEDGFSSSPSRVYRGLQAISDLYEIAARMKNQPKSDIYMVSCDSGSNLVFDFKGLRGVIREVKDIIISIWEKVIAYRKLDYAKRVDAVKETIPLIGIISKMADDGSLSPEEAHLLSRTLVNSVVSFVESGCMIPEILSESHFDPERLLRSRETLLLSSPA